jgi:ferredoxin/coenzyme F420-reducing hydrogenase delta subunit
MQQEAASLRQRGLNGWQAVERLFDTALGSRFNPLRHLGAVGVLALLLLVASGTILYILLDTSVEGAHRSIDALAAHPAGRLLRGIHRYAADALVIALGLHLLREFLAGHERSFRRFSWLTGVPLIGFVFVAAIGGFWLNWDQLGQYSATATAEWIDALPMLATPLARNFLVADAVSDRLFSLFIFVHIGVSLLLVFGLWFHVQRISRPAVLPPRRLSLGLVCILAALALAWPIASHAPATLATVPTLLRLDWILLFVHPLMDATSPGLAWALVGCGFLALFALPFLPQPAPAPVAVVDPANCNGCQRCFADCPYAAITMVPHPNQRIGRLLARVDPDLCAGCGICAGSCPSSTPFRRAAELVTGIDMPQSTIDRLRRSLRESIASSTASHPLVVFGCRHGASTARIEAADVSSFELLCAGQLPPAFVEYALRDGAAGVLVAPCRECGCEFRLGERWTIDRLLRRREPRLRAAAPEDRLALALAGKGDEPVLAAALAGLRKRVRSMPAQPGLGSRHHHA